MMFKLITTINLSLEFTNPFENDFARLNFKTLNTVTI